jgi:two-component sensor histidine kinase
LATIIRLALSFLNHEGFLAFATYFPAVLFSTLIGGLGAGCLALVLSVVISWWLFLPPYLSFQLPPSDQAVTLVVYTVCLATVLGGAEHYRRLVQQSYEEAHHRQLLAAELGHRVKNMLAIVFSILSRELKNHKHIWEPVSGRLRALALADDFIARSDRQGASISDILSMELAPYDRSQISTHWDQTYVPEKLATALALIFHEMTTNAAKYGALSNENGRIAISWIVVGKRIEIDWIESGGPNVFQPSNGGLGLKLFKYGLEPYQGKIDIQFKPQGVAYKISFERPEIESRMAPPLPIVGNRRRDSSNRK